MNRVFLRWVVALVAMVGLVLPPASFAAPSASIRRAAQTDGQYVVWLESADTPGAPTTLVAGTIGRDHTIGSRQVLTEQFWVPVNQTTFDLVGGGIVAWLEVDDDATTIVMRDLSNPRGRNTVIATIPQPTGVSVPTVASRRIAWREGSVIKRYDVAKGTTTTVATPTHVVAVSDPQVSGGWIVWATQTQAQINDPKQPGTLFVVSVVGTTVKPVDTVACGQICVYHLSGNRLLYPSTARTMQVRDLVSTKVLTDDGTSTIQWDIVDGDYVFDRHQPSAYRLSTTRTIALPFAPTDVRDGWLVGFDDTGAVRVARIRDLDRQK